MIYVPTNFTRNQALKGVSDTIGGVMESAESLSTADHIFVQCYMDAEIFVLPPPISH